MERKHLKTRTISEATRKRLDEINEKRSSGELPMNYKYRELTKLPEHPIDIRDVPPYDPNTRGRPPDIIDRDVYDAIIEKVREGNFLSVAARFAGLDPVTIMRYLEKGKNAENQLYYRFYMDMCKAEAEAETNRLKTLTGQAGDDWRAGLEILARRWPERWAKKDFRQVNIEGHVTHETRNELATQIVEDPVSRELARQLINRRGITIEPVRDDDESSS